ncbi:MAG: AraC family transcriptional regulator [Sulfuricurvum sp.]|uniref:helix-turn-helix domain-containing protein n=1 Tax=Sulfuricurvum sp. TaxID=2025608 RepID=UPI002621BD9C|nr:AraC family transcriptional regulator [Sulfuricurvum sp.]MDD2370207.1 AraC family transcriptional regulator [Sulfuricurvum sp.]MDD5118950.1 AraC family transcriptional regulator [Sulfuricurvum sp.]
MNIICHESPFIDSIFNLPLKSYKEEHEFQFIGAPSVHEHIILNDNCAVISFEINGKIHEFNSDLVCGKFTHPPKINVVFKNTSKKLTIIRLKSCGMFKLTDLPVSSIVDTILPRSSIDIDSVLNQKGEQYIKTFDAIMSEESQKQSYVITQHIIHYINTNFSHLPTNVGCEIAKEFNISESTLRRYFKKYLGINLSTYIMTVKRKKMIQSLYENNYDSMSVRESGYYDQSHFLNDFKRLYGIPLKQYFKDMKILQKQAPEFMKFLYHCNIQSDV